MDLVHRIPWRKICYSVYTSPCRIINKGLSTFRVDEIKQCFITLGVPINCDQETVRRAFVNLVKKYHPDSKSHEANASKFHEVEAAYRKLQDKFARDRFNVDEDLGEYGLYEEKGDDDMEHPDIQHTAPQHRQYLSYDGIGTGTPSQRYKHYTMHRAAKAVENVTEYRINRLQEDPHSKHMMKRGSKKKIKDIRTGFGMDRLVEDLIQESISRGEFDNLTGKGKPLKAHDTTHNPYVDFTTHKMNQVLIENGFTPTWISLQKEIRDSKNDLRNRLLKLKSAIGQFPLTEKDQCKWDQMKLVLHDDIKEINRKIDSYNLLVPLLHQQMFHLDIEKECTVELEKCTPLSKSGTNTVDSNNVKHENQTILHKFISFIFK